MSDRITYAQRALFWSLRRSLATALATLDTTRRARVICPPGPYTIPSSGTVIVNGTTIALTAGSRTAAQVAAEVNASLPGVASADASSGLVLASTGAPTEADPAEVIIGDGTANAALGLVAGDSDSVICALGSTRPRLLERELEWPGHYDAPTVGIDGIVRDVSVAPLRQDEAIVSIALACLVPGVAGYHEAARERTQAFVAAVADVIRVGDGRAGYLVGGEVYGDQIIKAEPGDPSIRMGSLGRQQAALPFGLATLPVTVRVYAP